MRTLWQLWISFWQVGLLSIGGGYATIPHIQKQVVEQAGWLSMREFTDIITISQMTPGPLAINTSTFVGLRIAGLPGAVVATVGCIFSGFIISLALYKFFQKYRHSDYIENALTYLKSASIGLIGAAGCTIFLLAIHSLAGFNWIALLVFAIGMVLLRTVRMNPLLVMALAGAAGLFLY